MYKVEWDKDTGGVILSSRVTKETLGISPRPVFHEELDLIGLDKLGWSYPHGAAPVMWAVNKQYWYRGTLLFEAKGANIYDAPTLGCFPLTSTVSSPHSPGAKTVRWCLTFAHALSRRLNLRLYILTPGMNCLPR